MIVDSRAILRKAAIIAAVADRGGGSDSPTGMEGDDPAGEVSPRHPLEARGTHPRGEVFLRREAADALDEILIGVEVAGDHPAEYRQNLERIGIVGIGQEGNGADRESGGEGKSGYVRVDLGGWRPIK